MTADDKETLDRVAELTVYADDRFHELRALYEATPYSLTVRSKLEEVGLT